MRHHDDEQIITRMGEIRGLLSKFGLTLSGFDPGVLAWKDQATSFNFDREEWAWLEPLLKELSRYRQQSTTPDARLREACVQFEKLLEREATYQHWTAYSGLDALKKVLKWWHEDRPWGVHAALASEPVSSEALKLHRKVEDIIFDGPVCTTCRDVGGDPTAWPCKTYQALTASQPRVLVDEVATMKRKGSICCHIESKTLELFVSADNVLGKLNEGDTVRVIVVATEP